MLLFVCVSYSNAVNSVQELESRLNSASEETRIQILLDLAGTLRGTDAAKSIDYARQAIVIAKKLNDMNSQALAYTIMADANFYAFNNFAKAIEYYQNSLNLYHKIGNQFEIAQRNNDIGISYRTIGNNEAALNYFFDALKIFQTIGDKPNISRTCNNIGNAYHEQSNLEKALEYYLLSLKAKENIGDKKGMSVTMNNIGVVFKKMKKYPEALEYFRKTLKLKEELGEKKGIAYSLNNIGNIYQTVDNYDKAIEFLGKALKIKEELGDVSGIASSLNNIGNCYNNKGDYTKALGYYLKSLDSYSELKDTAGIATSYLNIANINIKLNKYDDAELYLDKSIRFGKDNNKLDVVALTYYSYSLLYSNKGDNKKSDYYYKLYVSMTDSILSSENQKRVAEMQVKYDVEKKINENEQLKKENERKEFQLAEQRRMRYFWISLTLMILVTSLALLRLYIIKKKTSRLLEDKNMELNDKNFELEDKNEKLHSANKKLSESEEQLTQLNQTKDKFFSIIAHDLRNPFSSLSITLDLLRIHSDKMNKEQYINLISGMKNTIEKADDLLENLLEWSRSQTSTINYSPGKVSLPGTINEIIMLLNGAALLKNISFNFDSTTELTVFADKNMLLAILRNLIGNAIKFTHINGLVEINYRPVNGKAEVSIKDNGIGIPKENQEQLFRLDSSLKTPGTSNEKGTGLGLILCKEFVSRHGCDIWVESEPGLGSSFYFNLPLQDNKQNN